MMLFSISKATTLLFSISLVVAFAYRPSQASAIYTLGGLPNSLHAATDFGTNGGHLQERGGFEPDERIIPPLGQGQPPKVRKVHELLTMAEDAYNTAAEKDAPCRGCKIKARPWFENNSEKHRGLEISTKSSGTTYRWLVKSTHKLGQVMNSFCRTISITRNCIRFFYNGRAIHDDDTPDSIGMKKPFETFDWTPAPGFEAGPECVHPHEPKRILKAGDRVNLVNGYGLGVNLKATEEGSFKISRGQDLPGLMADAGVPAGKGGGLNVKLSGTSTRGHGMVGMMTMRNKAEDSNMGLNDPALSEASGASSSGTFSTPILKVDTATDLRKALTESLNLQKADDAGASSSQGDSQATQRAFLMQMTGPKAGQHLDFYGNRESVMKQMLAAIETKDPNNPGPSSREVPKVNNKKKKKKGSS